MLLLEAAKPLTEVKCFSPSTATIGEPMYTRRVHSENLKGTRRGHYPRNQRFPCFAGSTSSIATTPIEHG